MASEKELFVTKQYVPVGQPISKNDHTIIYKVKCLAEPGKPDGVLKMYRGKNIKSLYEKLQALDYSEWPHIYKVKYFDESTLVVEEFLTGHTLAELLQQNKARGIAFSEEEACSLMENLCYAIKQLMQTQPPIIHHNLKPSNIFITGAGAVKLIDFIPGYSKNKKNPMQNIMEILGALFHEMLTGKPPKDRKCTYEGRYEPVIRKCMEKSPEKQYSGIQELQESLEYAKTHEPESAPLIFAEIPYTLTLPFQGTILALEWILAIFSYYKENHAPMCLFSIVFIIHCVVFAVRRYTFFSKNNIHLSSARKAIPLLVLAGILGCLAWTVSFFFRT